MARLRGSGEGCLRQEQTLFTTKKTQRKNTGLSVLVVDKDRLAKLVPRVHWKRANVSYIVFPVITWSETAQRLYDLAK